MSGTHAIETTYVERTRKSAGAYLEATHCMPGGVARHSGFQSPYPLTLARARGALAWDIDGNEYLDAFNNFGSLVHGHAYVPVVQATAAQLERGTAWAANNLEQTHLARLICDRVSSVESLRFTNSGTEAIMLALLIARSVTGRPKTLMSRYGYHGWNPETSAGSFGNPSASTFVAPFNDAAAFESVLRTNGHEIAAVLLEPVLGSAGIIEGTHEFLARTLAAARAAGALVIFDEIITLRLGLGGVQGNLDLAPDLTTFGKIIGGGFAVGAVGGRSEIMSVLEPATFRIWHSGTFNGNPITMVAGATTLNELTAERIDTMDFQGARLREALLGAARVAGLPLSVTRAGSLLNLFFTPSVPESVVVRPDQKTIHHFHLAAINHGLLLASRGMMALSTVMTDEVITDIATRAASAMRDVAAELA